MLTIVQILFKLQQINDVNKIMDILFYTKVNIIIIVIAVGVSCLLEYTMSKEECLVIVIISFIEFKQVINNFSLLRKAQYKRYWYTLFLRLVSFTTSLSSSN